MSHHDGMDDELMNKLKNSFRDMGKLLGPTNKWPEGKLTPDDKGEIRIAIGVENGKVVIHFGKDITWIGFNPEQARELAQAIIDKADSIDKPKKPE